MEAKRKIKKINYDDMIKIRIRLNWWQGLFLAVALMFTFYCLATGKIEAFLDALERMADHFK